ncbi:Imm50 family immunity protein [Pseudomonas sp. SWRI154]|uniref:Imm50 family immunity protein n=1 Tax=Pseudomonas sp. SWRI154 TaxID=2745501 RepID=UPI001645E15F|nr:Imm50 family immunity protein [Pseudomonas sp. SWRI154]MBC3364826.1 hypothetical protein [Pseudomonas sp. SWRI154]
MWTDYITNKKKWTSVFGDNYTPEYLSIVYATLMDCSITLKLASPIETNNCPAKWIENGYNEFEFDLLLDQIDSISISKFNFHGSICITIAKSTEAHEILLKISDNCVINCIARGISISNIKAYYNDHSE